MKRREPLSLDLTPLIDVVFILIIFFLVSSSFKKETALSLTLPNVNVSSKNIEKNIVVIELNSHDIAYNGEKIDFVKLQSKLELIKDKKELLTIKIDKDVSYQKVVELFDILQLNELGNLALVTNK